METRYRPMPHILLPALLVTLAAAGVQAQPPAQLQKFLRDVIKFTDADLAAVEKGEVVARLLPTTDSGEIAAFGIVRVTSGLDRLEQLAKDPKRFRAMEGVEQIGVFSDPPAAGDVGALMIPKDDIDALQKCRPGSCDVKLTDAALERVAAVDWSATDATEQATRVCRDMMVALASSYQSGGIEALGTTVDKNQPKLRAEEFHRLLQNSPYLFEYVPAFSRYLESYPRGSLEGAATTLYWTKDTFSPKLVISLCASTVVRVDEHVEIASILLAATHFFNAGLDVCIGVPASSAPGSYVLDVYRVRIDPPTGMMAGTAMKRVESGIAKGVEKKLSGLRDKLK